MKVLAALRIGAEPVPDVVIAGYGPAGAAAAIAAHDAGCHVLVLESTERGGGNTRYSGGFLFDVPDEAAVAHLDALCFGRTDRRVLEAYAAGLHELDGWLRSLGATTAPFEPPPARLPAPFPSWPHLPAGRRIRYRTVAGGNGRRGEALWDLLDAAVRARGIEVRYQAAAERLVLGPGGSVTGLAARQAGKPAGHEAAGGVILACGGFEANPGLADAYLPLGPSWPVGHPGNTGAGLAIAQQAGAALWHMYGCFGWFAFRTPDFPSPFAVDFFGASHVFVDADGHRFADETGYEVHDRLRAPLTYLPRNPNRPRLPSWAVFDEAARLAGPPNGLLGTPNDYAWSPDNSAEVERGWVLSAAGPAELAGRMGVDPELLTGTLEQYNASARPAGTRRSAGRRTRSCRWTSAGGPGVTGPGRRVAAVTGGSGAIGASIAAALAAAGHQVIILDQAGDPPVDLADEHQVRAAAGRILDQAGRCDVLVHAAAAFDRADLARLDLAVWRRVQAVNVESALLLAQAFVPGMAARGFGRIIFVASDTIWAPPASPSGSPIAPSRSRSSTPASRLTPSPSARPGSRLQTSCWPPSMS